MNVEHEGVRALKPRSRGDAVDEREKQQGPCEQSEPRAMFCKMKSRNGDVKAGSLSRGKADGARFSFYRGSELGILIASLRKPGNFHHPGLWTP